MKCYNCGNNVVRNKYSYCPYCGKCLSMTSHESYLMTMADSAQANRIEAMLNELTTKYRKEREGEQ